MEIEMNANQWKLEYEKPENSDDVLIAPKARDIVIGYWLDDDGVWMHQNEKDVIEGVKYWAPLPPLP